MNIFIIINMGVYEKTLGLLIVPTLYIVLLLLAIGIGRR